MVLANIVVNCNEYDNVLISMNIICAYFLLSC